MVFVFKIIFKCLSEKEIKVAKKKSPPRDSCEDKTFWKNKNTKM